MSTKPRRRADHDPPEGFTLRPDSAAGLLLPTRVLADIEEDRLKEEEAVSQKRMQERALERAAELKEDEKRAALRIKADLENSSPTSAEEEITEPAYQSNSKRQYKIYAMASVAELLRKAQLLTPDKDIRKRDETLAKQLKDAGVYRQVAESDGKKELKQSQELKDLGLAHPHFAEVIDFVSQHLTLSSRSKTPLSLPPILLNGEPGLGKTHFAFELAEAIDTCCRRVALDTPVTAATLMGSDRRWGNTQYGLLFELICLGRHANPIVILDELDKAIAQRDWNPVAPLHSLLEPSTAAKTRDLSVDFEFDASQVIWIATTNNCRLLSSPIRSRFKEFDIRRPDAAGALASCRAVLAKSFRSLDLEDFEEPGKDLAVAVAHLTAREITQVLKQSVATAIVNGKQTVGPDDLPAHVRDEIEHRGLGAGKPKTWLH
jgi:ATP-dependent Lon protease